MEKVSCTRCGALILPTTAERTGGLCMPCKAGTREQIEESKRRYAREKELDKTCPFLALWRTLHQKVFAEDGGFKTLSAVEQRYWAVNVLVGEVYNGGFDQYFFNSSGALYRITVEALNELAANNARSLLFEAKHALFGERHVPEDTEERRQLLLALWPEPPNSLNTLDETFWKNEDQIENRLEQYALKHGLVPDQKLVRDYDAASGKSAP
jgi:hypothetical protein